MDAFSMSNAFERGRAALRARLTLRGPRAYANTHAVALSLLERDDPGKSLTTDEELASSSASRRALDLGAGRGELSTNLVARGYDVTAVERSSKRTCPSSTPI
jgi:2-polyprenyl-3-methyl-5-hydroxy-6-metoxy-1,4-benzoquinol methylase